MMKVISFSLRFLSFAARPSSILYILSFFSFLNLSAKRSVVIFRENIDRESLSLDSSQIFIRFLREIRSNGKHTFILGKKN